MGNYTRWITILEALMKGIVGSTTFTTEKDHYKTTYLRKELNGETSKRIEFYNEAGQLQRKKCLQRLW